MRKRIVVSISSIILLAAGVILLAGGDKPAASPTTPISLSPATIYLVQLRVYLDPAYIVAAQDMTPGAVDRIIAMLEALEPPAEFAATHQQVLAGYRFIRDGQQIMATTPKSDGVQRAEGAFLVSWGVSRLLEVARQLPVE
jgi:hypothetical protein